MAQEFNLTVILRPGPFIDAERDMVIYNRYKHSVPNPNQFPNLIFPGRPSILALDC